MRVRILLLVLATLTLLLWPLALPAHAAASSGCSGDAMSFSNRGIPLDKFSAPGSGGTEARPFEIMWNGNIEWSGQTDDVIKNGTWQVNVRNSSWLFKLGELAMGRPNGVSGDITNQSGETKRSGVFAPSSKIPVMFPGTYEVTLAANGKGGAACTGTVWVKVVDSPTGTPLFWAALVLMLIALIMLGFIGYTKAIGAILTEKPE